MTSPHPRRLHSRNLALGLPLAVAGALFLAVPASAQQTVDEPCAGDLHADSESEASALAASCDTTVIVESSQDYTMRTLAQPDGSFSSEFTMVPRWVPDETGEWVEADPTVEADTDGTLAAAAAVADVRFGGAGAHAFATVTHSDGEVLALTWPETLPAPEVDGATVTYPEVLPGVDLEVYSGVTDLSYALVVKTPEAAASAELESVELGIESEGLTVESEGDTATLVDDQGEVAFSVAEPWMWDSSQNDSATPELAVPMDLEIDADSLVVVPDQELLADPDAVYPIYIDPQITFTDAAYENAFSEATGITCGSGDMCTGFQGWSSDLTNGSWRTALKFDGLSVLEGRDIQQANVWVTQTHTGGAGANHTVRLYAMNWFDFGAATSWSTFNSKLYGLVATDSVPTSNGDAGEGDQRIAWADARTATRIQTIADAGSNTAVFGVFSGASSTQEANRNYWRKLSPSSAQLTVWHGPKAPTSLVTNGAACSTSAPGPVINTLTPTLKATAPNPLTSSNIFKFYVYEKAGVPDDHLRKIEVNNVGADAAVTVSVPSGVLERGKTYRWNSRVQDSDSDSTRTSDFTGYCYFTVNALPTVPTSLSTDGLGCGTQAAPTFVTTGTPDLSARPNDPDTSSLTAKFEVYDSAGALKQSPTRTVAEGVTAQATLAELASGLYKWRVLSADAFASSAWSSYCWMQIDTDAPEPPQVLQLNEGALPGDTVNFRFIGGTDVVRFEYSLDSAARVSVPATGGVADAPIATTATGPIDRSLQVWAYDAAGNPSSHTLFSFILIAPEPVETIGTWRFDGDLADDAGDNDLTAVGAAITGADREGRSDAAAVLDGNGSSCLRAEGTVIDTADSYTLAAWAYTAAAPAAEAAVMDVTGAESSHLKLLLTSTGRWGVAMTSADTGPETVAAFAPAASTEYGQWTHLAAVYDAVDQRVRLYVNGTLAATKEMPYLWSATGGALSVGCGVKASGSTFSPFTGSVDDAAVFQQPLTAGQVADLMDGKGTPASLQAWYPLRGDGLDATGSGNDLTDLPSDPKWRDDQYDRPGSALDFDGATCPTSETPPVRTDAAYSVSAWVLLDSSHTNLHSRIFSFSGTAAYAAMAKYNDTLGRWEVTLTSADASGSATSGVNGGTAVGDGVWTHIATTVDTDRHELQLYVNGTLAVTKDLGATWTSWRSGEFIVGCGGTTDGTRSSQWLGAISDVRVWRGVATAEQITDAYDQVHPDRVSHWELGKSPSVQGLDAWGDNDLTFNGDVEWVTDRWNACWAAYGLDLNGTGHAATANSVVRTDDSFSVSVWTKIDDNDADHTVLSQTTSLGTGFEITYKSELDKWVFSMRNSAADGGDLVTAESEAEIELEVWYHLTATYDVSTGKMRLYINGAEQNDGVQGPAHPWFEEGELLLGAAGDSAGGRASYMAGSVDQVYAWTGVLDAYTVSVYAGAPPPPEVDESNPACEGTTPPDID